MTTATRTPALILSDRPDAAAWQQDVPSDAAVPGAVATSTKILEVRPPQVGTALREHWRGAPIMTEAEFSRSDFPYPPEIDDEAEIGR